MGAPERGPLGEALLALRRQAGRTLRQLADEVGCSPSTLSDAERGKSRPSWALVERVVYALDGDVERFRHLQIGNEVVAGQPWWEVSLTFTGRVCARSSVDAMAALKAELGVVDESRRTARVTQVRALQLPDDAT